ncbi:50S ribosomal protein L36 [Streptomyces sp. NPDC002044]
MKVKPSVKKICDKCKVTRPGHRPPGPPGPGRPPR